MAWFGPNKRERLSIAEATKTRARVVTAAYTLAADDVDGVVEVNSSSGVTVTVPADVFTAGQVVQVCQIGSGLVTLAAGDGATIRNPGNTLKLGARYGTVSLRFRSPTEAVLTGNVASS